MVDESLWGCGPDDTTHARNLVESTERVRRLQARLASDPRTARYTNLPGIDRVRAEFPGDVLTLLSWLLAPNEELGGVTPWDALEAGETDAVVAVARALGG